MEAIESLKNRLEQNTLIVHREEGYVEKETFNFYPPASEKEFKRLPGYAPKELIAFLKIHNGADLFVHPEYGGGTHFFSVSEILEHIKKWECPKFFLPIGTGLDGLWIVCQSVPGTDENFIWVGEFIDFKDEFHKLDIDYTTWLERYIVAQGDPFWEGSE